ncbi:HAD family hydrolase [Kineococcus gynurae]|uniref:HAD family hydrolase n=1 Tax=Kineococcus gynurae TaxID=452979 RepID=A0ABV5LUN4_9ACTN
MLLAASDLDQTLIFSSRSARAETRSLVPVERYRDADISWVTPTAWHSLAALVRTGRFVPVTTRTPEQYLRVRWPGRPPEHAVTANGGIILRHGVPDPDWTAAVTARVGAGAPVEEVAGRLRDLTADLQAAVPGSADPTVRVVPGLFAYAVLREGQRPVLEGARLGELTAELLDLGYACSLQGRKLYAVPVGVTKSAAVGELVDRCGAAGFVAAGDSLLDVDLLRAARASRRPRHGELFLTGADVAGSELTAAAGAAAGEEIAAWLLGCVEGGLER